MTKTEFTKLALKEAKQKHYHRLGEVPPNCVRCADFVVGASFGFEQGVAAVLEMLKSADGDEWADWLEAKLADRKGGAKE